MKTGAALAAGSWLGSIGYAQTHKTAARAVINAARNDQVPFVDVAATMQPQNGRVAVFMLNRDLDSERELILDWREPTPARVLTCETLTGTDLSAANSFERPTAVAPRPLDSPQAGPRMTFKLPPRSHSVATIATS